MRPTTKPSNPLKCLTAAATTASTQVVYGNRDVRLPALKAVRVVNTVQSLCLSTLELFLFLFCTEKEQRTKSGGVQFAVHHFG